MWGRETMRVLNQIFKVFSWIVITAIIIYMAIAAPILLGYRPLVVLSGSMEPTYPVGSIIYYHDCTFEEIEAGDPITFYAGNSLVTHRAAKVDEVSRTVVTKGDNNTSEDPVPVAETEIAGIAADFAIPFAGYFVTYGKNPIAIASMVIILLLNYVLEGIVSRQKEGKENNEQKDTLQMEPEME